MDKVGGIGEAADVAEGGAIQAEGIERGI